MILKNQLIIYYCCLPYKFRRGLWMTRFANELGKENKVIVFYPETPLIKLKGLIFSPQKRKIYFKLLKSLRKKEGKIEFIPFFIIPFLRFSFIYKLNLKIIEVFFKLTIMVNRRKPIVWLTHPNISIPYLKPFSWNKKSIIYDCQDQICILEDPKEDKKIRQKEREVMKQADIVLVFSDVHFREKKAFAKKIIKVPTGHLQNFFLNKNKFTKISEMEKIPSPRIGYIGSLCYRLDFSLLLEIMRRNPGFNFIFVGSIFRSSYLNSPVDKFLNFDQKLKKIIRFKNFYHLGKKSQTKIPDFINYFDVCIIPYDIKQETNKYCNPIKAYEYLALGKPIVSTPILALKRFNKYIYFANDPQQFEEKIKITLRQKISKTKKEKMRQIALNNTASSKLKFLKKAIFEKI